MPSPGDVKVTSTFKIVCNFSERQAELVSANGRIRVRLADEFGTDKLHPVLESKLDEEEAEPAGWSFCRLEEEAKPAGILPDGVSASPEQAEPAGTAPPAVSPHPGACPGACPGVSPPPVPPVVSPYINGIEANIMEVLATGDAEVLCRPCVDCGVRTGSYCDWCEAVDRMPSEQWAHGQMTPLCTRCDSIHDECHFCRDLPWCTPPTKPFHTDAAL